MTASNVDIDILALVKICTIVFLGWYLAKSFYVAFLGPLSKIPGRKRDAFAIWLSLPTILAGKDWLKNRLIHAEFGPIIRTGPNFLFVGDRDAIKKIVITEDFPKAQFYKLFRRKSDEETLFSGTDKKFHKLRRRMLSPAFSIKYLASLEPLIKNCFRDVIIIIDHLINDLSMGVNGRKQSAIINIYQIIHNCSLDVIGETAFGRKFDMVLTNKHQIPDEVRYSLRRMVMVAFLPFARLFMRERKYLEEFVTKLAKTRRQQHPDVVKKDILQILLDSVDDENTGLTDYEILGQIEEFMIAGSDTTSFSTSIAMILLSRHQRVLEKLFQEIRAAIPEIGPDNLPDYALLKELPYLNAVINETLRLWPITLNGLTIRELTKDIMIGPYHVPAGTVVFPSTYYLHTNKELWGPDALEFVPERWLVPERIPKDAFYPFSAGSRNCIGQNFALLEMRLIIASLVRRYEFTDIPGQPFDIKHFITPMLTNHQYNILMNLRNED
ncbi:122_t:CDS:10 [Ambispora leptoticha]|uniref:122_t:CDS:1 n=1 Tax=Ambispora leptoticha TaxID=144679 RepID=A0A9N8VKA0_9GLOM|nr:122_t:CDS:10 [Ambispora leptoticha]